MHVNTHGLNLQSNVLQLCFSLHTTTAKQGAATANQGAATADQGTANHGTATQATTIKKAPDSDDDIENEKIFPEVRYLDVLD